MKTYSLKPQTVSRKWYLLDAGSLNLGRLSTASAKLLIGKEKLGFTPHVDNGDFVIIINSDSLKTSGNKNTDKTYYRHSGYPGGLYKRSLEEQMKLDSTKVIEHAIRGMLPVNKLRSGRLARLKVYKTSDHPHAPQQPIKVDLRAEETDGK